LISSCIVRFAFTRRNSASARSDPGTRLRRRILPSRPRVGRPPLDESRRAHCRSDWSSPGSAATPRAHPGAPSPASPRGPPVVAPPCPRSADPACTPSLPATPSRPRGLSHRTRATQLDGQTLKGVLPQAKQLDAVRKELDLSAVPWSHGAHLGSFLCPGHRLA
jgi:hypothetical protein